MRGKSNSVNLDQSAGSGFGDAVCLSLSSV